MSADFAALVSRRDKDRQQQPHSRRQEKESKRNGKPLTLTADVCSDSAAQRTVVQSDNNAQSRTSGEQMDLAD